MPDLLLELFGEEIPARMQADAAAHLKKAVTDRLVEAGCLYEGARALVTPRRLALSVHGLPAASPETREERKGPRVGAPDAAVQGFLKGAGLASLDQARIVSDPKKGDFYVADIVKPGRPTATLIAEIVRDVILSFPWPKSMRSGLASVSTTSLRWVRPLHSILCVFGPETEDPEVIPIVVEGVACGDETRGHRFMAPAPFKVRRLDDYLSSLHAAYVVADPEERKRRILADAQNLCFAQGLELVDDEGLLNEVAGLVEWPVVLMGAFDADFLAIPDEVIRATIRANQKCFVVRDPKTGRLANRFVLTANIEASDGGKAIVAGNERVIRARLSDALYFWTTDQKPLPDAASDAYAKAAEEFGLDLSKPLDQRMAKLASLNVVFHEKLGTQGERVKRIMALAEEIAPKVGADPALARRAAALAKADLTTEVVGEFPEVQGLMGRKYAELQGEHPSVCAAIEDHYKPQGPIDRVPTDPVAIAVALADKLDTLVGFWAIDEKPTGSKDPFALRRAALGAIRLVLDNQIYLSVIDTGISNIISVMTNLRSKDSLRQIVAIENLDAVFNSEHITDELYNKLIERHESDFSDIELEHGLNDLYDLLAFFHDRLKVLLRDQGRRHDLVDAVLGSGGANDDLLLVVRRVEALSSLLASEDGKNLLAGMKRALNILRIEEKKDSRAYDAAPDAARLVEPAEIALEKAAREAAGAAAALIETQDFEGAMRLLAGLRPAVDAFFADVTVNAPDPALRENRLRLLNLLRQAVAPVADFDKIQG